MRASLLTGCELRDEVTVLGSCNLDRLRTGRTKPDVSMHADISLGVVSQLKLPLIAFWVKTAAEVINLAIYGRQGSERRFGESRDEGFWCAAFSCALSGIVAAMLLYHYAVQRHKTLKDSLK